MNTVVTDVLGEVSQTAGIHRLLVVDDHPGFRRGIKALVDMEPDLSVCGEADCATAAIEAMRRLKPDGAIIDISMPGTNGIELIKMMLAEVPRLPILVLSMHEESLYGLRALKAGAKGYVMKAEAMDSVLTAIRTILAGELYVSPAMGKRLIFRAVEFSDAGESSPVDRLSDRELEILQMMGTGLSTREIAEKLHLSIKTIETHRANIKQKLGFKESGEMVRFAIEWVGQQEL